MITSRIHRAVALALSATFTLAMLASVDLLAQPEVAEDQPQWALQAAPRA